MNIIRVNKIKELNEEMRCSVCEKPLSMSPVYCTADMINLCGRCVSTHSENELINRQHVYESVAKHMVFPCSYKEQGCEEDLEWNKANNHESVCRFKATLCPLFYEILPKKERCKWSGLNGELKSHIEGSHKDLIIDPPQISFDDSKTNRIYFTHVGRELITIVIKYEKTRKYYCLLLINQSELQSQCYRYQLELYDENKVHSLILRMNCMESYANVDKYLKDSDKMLEVDLQKVFYMLRKPTLIFGRFGIVRKNKKEIAQITGVTCKSANNSTESTINDSIFLLDEEMLQELECPICNEYMIPPIFICQRGHSVCSECNARVDNCPSCKSVMSGARNFTLEKLTTRVNYPCKFSEIGCAFITTSDKIRSHEEHCDYKDKDCVFSTLLCAWKGYGPSMADHMRTDHANKILEANTFHMRDLKDELATNEFVICAGLEVFRVFIKHSTRKGPLRFNVEHLGTKPNDPQYTYILQFQDTSNLSLNFSFSNICKVFSNDPNSGAISISYDMLQPFIFCNQYVYYSIALNKISKN